MVSLAIQNGKTGVRGNYDWRAVSERALHKKARHDQNGLVLDTTCLVAAGAGARNWSCGPSDKECRHHRLIRILLHRPSGRKSPCEKGVGTSAGGPKARASQRVGRSEVGTDLNTLLI